MYRIDREREREGGLSWQWAQTERERKREGVSGRVMDQCSGGHAASVNECAGVCKCIDVTQQFVDCRHFVEPDNVQVRLKAEYILCVILDRSMNPMPSKIVFLSLEANNLVDIAL